MSALCQQQTWQQRALDKKNLFQKLSNQADFLALHYLASALALRPASPAAKVLEICFIAVASSRPLAGLLV